MLWVSHILLAETGERNKSQSLEVFVPAKQTGASAHLHLASFALILGTCCVLFPAVSRCPHHSVWPRQISAAGCARLNAKSVCAKQTLLGLAPSAGRPCVPRLVHACQTGKDRGHLITALPLHRESARDRTPASSVSPGVTALVWK